MREVVFPVVDEATLGNLVREARASTGIAEAPAPCSNRPPTGTGIEGDGAHAMDPSANVASPRAKKRWRPKRSDTLP